MLGRWCLVGFLILSIGCGSDSSTSEEDLPYTDFLTADEELVDLDCTEVVLPIDAAGCETSLGTIDELSRSPRCWPGTEDPSVWGIPRMDRLEVLAARVSGKVVADQAIYERIIRDMGSMRALWPQRWFLGEYVPGAANILIEADESTLSAMRSGSYYEWDCLNRLFRATDTLRRSSTLMELSFGGVYDLRLLAGEYQKLPGVTRAYPNGFAGDWGEICAIPGADEWHYIFDEASGDCPSGCIDHVYHHFITLPTGEVKRDGRWEYNRNEQAPDWFMAYVSPDVCH